MAVQLEIILIAGVVAIGLIVLGRAIATGVAISRRQAHHLSKQTGGTHVPPSADVPPPAW